MKGFAILIAGVFLLSSMALGQTTQRQTQHGSTGHGMQGQMHGQGHQGQMMKMPMNMAEHQKMMTEMMLKQLGGKDEHFDHRFIEMMITHHRQAIEMAKVALKNATHPELKQMAEKMIADQEGEIHQMEQWQKDWYGGASATTSHHKNESR